MSPQIREDYDAPIGFAVTTCGCPDDRTRKFSTIRPMFVKMNVGHTSKTSQTSLRNDTRSPTGMSTHAVRPSTVANFIFRQNRFFDVPKKELSKKRRVVCVAQAKLNMAGID